MESCLYTGWVGHRRTAHAVNEFRYSLFFLYLDLAELDHVFDGRPALVGGALQTGPASAAPTTCAGRDRWTRPCGRWSKASWDSGRPARCAS